MPEQAEHDTGGRVTATRAAHKATAALCAARGGPYFVSRVEAHREHTT